MADGAAAAQGNAGVSFINVTLGRPAATHPELMSFTRAVLQELDLFGSRDFLTAATAEQALAPMLAQGSSVSKVSLPCSKACCWHMYTYYVHR
jgi:hypothetical protein